MAAVKVKQVVTSPIAGQKTGTSGLRKKVVEFQKENYVENWTQSLFNALKESEAGEFAGQTLVIGGDGRFYNAVALKKIIRVAAGNGWGKVVVGQNGIFSTPAVSAVIRSLKARGGIILTASHNPGGPTNDFGIKYNDANGGPATEKLTATIFTHTETIKQYTIADIGDDQINLNTISATSFERESGGSFTLEVVDSVDQYQATLASVFSFDDISALLKRKDFPCKFDAMHGVTAPYVNRILVGCLGADGSTVMHGDPKEDFGGLHPDPNLTYAKELVDEMYTGKYEFGAAWDGDGDRNMLLGNKFFVTPSDSVAIIAAYAQKAIPYFSKGLSAVARSMPTSAALDLVAKKLNLTLFEVPTGWKFFGNIMDHFEHTSPGVICGEESFGTGSDHVREKDGLWATLAWLSILAYRNRDPSKLVTVEDIVMEHWKEYGRNYYSRYDYEGVDADAADKVMNLLVSKQSGIIGKTIGKFIVSAADEFEYCDQFDQSVSSHQGIRFMFSDGSRIVFRLSGTGSVGATIRLYLEQYRNDDVTMETADALKDLVAVALELCEIQSVTGRKEPTVIT